MKKLMIALAAVAVAAGVQAATYNWNVDTGAGGQLFTPSSDPDEIYEGTPVASATMYLFAMDSGLTQQDIYNAIFVNKMSLAEAAATYGGTAGIAMANGAVSDGPVRVTTEGDSATQWIFAVVDDGNGKFFFDDEVEYTGDTSPAGAPITLDQSWSGIAEYDFTKMDGWQGSTGWYAQQSIPEPTSGLLLLLGVAGLALRRRRA